MPTLSECLRRKKLSPTRLAELMGVEDINAMDPVSFGAALRELKDDIGLRKFRSYRQAKANSINAQFIESYRTPSGKSSPKEGLESLVGQDLKERGGNTSLEARAAAILNEAQATLYEFMDTYKPKKLGFSHDPEAMKNFFRELWGESTDDVDAKAFAKEWTRVNDALQKRFNDAGGASPKLADWRMPTSHSPHALRIAAQKAGGSVQGKANWLAFIKPRLDMERMAGELGIESARNPSQAMDDVLGDIYDSILTEGASKIDPGKVPSSAARGMLANRHAEKRWLHFKNSESWLSYQKKFGSPDLFANATYHLDRMARDIAAIEMLGPNPDAAMEYLGQMVRLAHGNNNADTYAKALYDTTMGFDSVGSNTLGDVGANVRNLHAASKLGSALLASVADVGTATLTAMYNGLPIIRMWTSMFKGMDKKLAAQLLLGVEHATDAMLRHSRYGEIVGHGITARLADFTLKASLLRPWTEGLRRAFGVHYWGTLANEANVKFADLSPARRDAFRRHGITEIDWNKARRAKKLRHNGVYYLDPANWTDVELQAKFVGLITTEMDRAIVTPNARTRTRMRFNQKRGTFGGEVASHIVQFKNHPVSMTMLHGTRGIYGHMSKTQYFGNLLVMTTVLGGLALQLRAIAQGRDPQDMDRWDFWGRALTQGGGAGIIGDFVFSDQNRYGGFIGEYSLGPSAKLVNDLLKATMGNISEVIDGKETHAGVEFYRIGESLVPAQNIWQIRLFVDRALKDTLRSMVDPDAASKQQAHQARLERETGQEYFAPPGEGVIPKRLPKVPAPLDKSSRDSSYTPDF